MKIEFLLPLSLICAGCQSANPPPKSIPPTPSPALHTAPIAIRVPETIKTYAVGAYVDPNDESVRHDAHLIHRLEKPAYWSLAPTASESAPATLTPLAPPTPIVTPLLPSIPPAPPSNHTGTVPVITPPVPTPAVPLIAANSASPAAPASAQPVELEPLLAPNADGVIDVAALDQSSDDDSNPFAVHVLAPGAIREISLRVGGVFTGASSGALVNDRPLLIGETAESLILARVEPDAAVFRAGLRLLRVPASGKPVVVRLLR